MKRALICIALLICCGFTSTDTVITRFKLPAGYEHEKVEPGSFGAYLQSLPLKPIGSKTLIYTGAIAQTDIFTAAVVDLSVGKVDLQQCADVVMRLRGEYLYQQKRYSEIAFHFESGFNCDYIHYADGYRYNIAGGRWVLKAKKDYTYATFMRYMNLVFSYAGTLSLQKELKPAKNADDLKTGDVFIHGGSPGHCFIVIDVIENREHQKKFLIAQSFMPAQNLQVLQYNGNPWFTIDKKTGIWYGELIDKAYLRTF
jgi:hypothetical protein